MGWLDSTIAYFSPQLALKRHIARSRLTRLETYKKKERGFDAVSSDRMRYDFITTAKSADAYISEGAEKLRQHIRQMEYNNGFVAGPVKRIVNNVVGLGIRFQSRVKADETYFSPPESMVKIRERDAQLFNALAERGFKRWAKQADVRLLANWSKIQRLVQAELIRSGEALIVGRTSKRPGRFVPYCLEVLEIDRLGTPFDELRNPLIKNGIEYDSEGVPVAYWIMKEHPGDTLKVIGRKTDSYERIPAYNANGTRKVLHLFDILRPEQSRGFSEYAAGLKDFQDLDRYREAEIMAALEDACMTGFVKTERPDDYQGAYTVADSDEDDAGNTQRIHEFAPNKWHYLQPGEDVHIHSPQRPNDQLDHLVNHLLRGPSNALDIPPEVLAQNWQGMNYSNARTVLLQFYLSMRVRQAYLIDTLCNPVYENVLADMVLMGYMGASGASLYNSRRDDVLNVAWIPGGWSWVDPLKESQGKTNDVENNFDTLTNVCASQGEDVDETLETRARELKKIKELEEKYGIQFPKKTPAPVQAQPDDEETKTDGGRKLAIVE